MKQHNIVMMFSVIVTLLIVAFIVIELGKDPLNSGNQNPETNWKWDDNWISIPMDPFVSIRNQSVSNDKPKEEKPKEEPKVKIVANSYEEAIKLSSENGRPVMAFFTANWCKYCLQMKPELEKPEVSKILNDYIVVYVDVDKDKIGSKKFGVTSLPSYVVTNSKEERLKFGSGFKNAESFSQWLSQ